ncbi:hypothetical protein Taro_011391 [Colocasia esculenta]|uniref:Uncharacterized protein n=1 Tax=Colocasia esculenta TaxID=4460 RepID=A0A843U649_COLES|nr:hypothetical protein [Colocasia esculenta]
MIETVCMPPDEIFSSIIARKKDIFSSIIARKKDISSSMAHPQRLWQASTTYLIARDFRVGPVGRGRWVIPQLITTSPFLVDELAGSLRTIPRARGCVKKGHANHRS